MTVYQVLIPCVAAVVGGLLGFFFCLFLTETIKDDDDQNKTQDDNY